MAIDMSSAQDVFPQSAKVEEAGAGFTTKVDVDALPKTKPTEAAAQALDPLSGAGVDLTRWVLIILASVLLIILGNLVYDQGVFTSSTRDAFVTASMANPALSLANSLDPQLRTALIPIRDTLREIRADSDPKATRDLLNKVLLQLEKLAAGHENSHSNDEIKKLLSAIQVLTKLDKAGQPNPSALAPVRESIENLIDTSSPSFTADTLLAKKELLSAYAAAAQATRDFWMQVSQMILINLLLPVLTALLGYVFASKNNK